MCVCVMAPSRWRLVVKLNKINAWSEGAAADALVFAWNRSKRSTTSRASPRLGTSTVAACIILPTVPHVCLHKFFGVRVCVYHEEYAHTRQT